MPSPTAASSVMPIDWSTRPISSIATQRLVKSPSSPRAAVLLGRGEPEQPELAHLLHHVDREVVVAVPLRGVRRDLGLGELADAAAELLVLAGSARKSSVCSWPADNPVWLTIANLAGPALGQPATGPSRP